MHLLHFDMGQRLPACRKPSPSGGQFWKVSECCPRLVNRQRQGRSAAGAGEADGHAKPGKIVAVCRRPHQFLGQVNTATPSLIIAAKKFGLSGFSRRRRRQGWSANRETPLVPRETNGAYRWSMRHRQSVDHQQSRTSRTWTSALTLSELTRAHCSDRPEPRQTRSSSIITEQTHTTAELLGKTQ